MIELAGPKIEKNVILCPTCKGEGSVKYIHRESGHDAEHRKKICDRCEGSGRLNEKITIELTPFKEGRNNEH